MALFCLNKITKLLLLSKFDFRFPALKHGVSHSDLKISNYKKSPANQSLSNLDRDVNMSILMRFREWSSRKKLRKLKRTGHIIDAKIQRIIEEPFKKMMVIRAIASATVVDKQYTFRSEIIWKDEEFILKIGDVVKILIDYSNPKNYYFDPKQKDY